MTTLTAVSATKRTGPVAPVSTAPWRNRIVGTGEEAPHQLLANPANWRIHPKTQQAALAGALDHVGWVQQALRGTRPRGARDGPGTRRRSRGSSPGLHRTSARSASRSRSVANPTGAE